DETGWREAHLGAALPGGGRLEARLEPENGHQRLTVSSSNAGDLLQALDQTNRIQGGELSLNAVITRREPTIAAEGTFKIEDFTLLNAPVIARLLTLASLTGIGNLLGGEGIFFDRLDLPFELRDGALTFDRGRMSGSQVGLTLNGSVELETDQLDLEGTVVPVYTVNRVLGNIPLVGPFLAGKEGEGAFAATYWVQGELSDPQITVNPLAVLAPGFIRDLFSGLIEGNLEPPEAPQDRN
ncbi:MAG: AsmA-like C-terminal region-containing protein, partial [Geminicoccales bacterium]